MAETTRPARRRATTPKAAPKAAATAAAGTAPKAAATVSKDATAADGVVTLEIPYSTDTARYSKFVVPESLKGTLAGTIYAPLGTSRVLLKVIGQEVTAEASDE